MRSTKWALGVVTAVALLAVPVTAGAVPQDSAAVAAPAGVSHGPALSASIDGARLSRATEGHPLVVRPDDNANVSLTMRNGTGRALQVRSVNLEGHIAGLTFFAFDTEVAFNLGPSQSKTLNYVLDVSALDGQATGLVPSELVLAGPRGHVIASESFVADVHGSLWSVYGLFGLGIVLLTILALAQAVSALARGRLPVNRWRRGSRFLAPGLGVGGVFVFSASALGKWLPSDSHWLLILAIAGAVGFTIGYLTPTPVPPVGEMDIDESEDGLGETEGTDVGPLSGTHAQLGHLTELNA